MSALPSEIGQRPPPTIVSAFSLLKNFKPIETTVDGIPAPRGGLVSITAPTGHGKTTISALLQVAYVRELRFAGREVTKGSVLVLAGENPDDYTMHLAATAQDNGVDGADLSRNGGQLLVIPGTFDVMYEWEWLLGQMQATCRDLVAVFVDTSAAFYSGDDENDNVAMRRHASALRELTALPGRPTVYVMCHPTKTALKENLLPRGGGAFLAEVDANLTLWKDDAGIVTLHWAGKIRGPSFDPIRFEFVPVELAGVTDARGRPIISVAARHVADERAEQIHEKEIDDQDVMLIAMQRRPGASVGDLATACGWTSGTGKPLKSRADRRLQTLKSLGLAEQERKGTWRLTPKGTKEADRLP